MSASRRRDVPFGIQVGDLQTVGRRGHPSLLKIPGVNKGSALFYGPVLEQGGQPSGEHPIAVQVNDPARELLMMNVGRDLQGGLAAEAGAVAELLAADAVEDGDAPRRLAVPFEQLAPRRPRGAAQAFEFERVYTSSRRPWPRRSISRAGKVSKPVARMIAPALTSMVSSPCPKATASAGQALAHQAKSRR